MPKSKTKTKQSAVASTLEPPKSAESSEVQLKPAVKDPKQLAEKFKEIVTSTIRPPDIQPEQQTHEKLPATRTTATAATTPKIFPQAPKNLFTQPPEIALETKKPSSEVTQEVPQKPLTDEDVEEVDRTKTFLTPSRSISGKTPAKTVVSPTQDSAKDPKIDKPQHKLKPVKPTAPKITDKIIEHDRVIYKHPVEEIKTQFKVSKIPQTFQEFKGLSFEETADLIPLVESPKQQKVLSQGAIKKLLRSSYLTLYSPQFFKSPETQNKIAAVFRSADLSDRQLSKMTDRFLEHLKTNLDTKPHLIPTLNAVLYGVSQYKNITQDFFDSVFNVAQDNALFFSALCQNEPFMQKVSNDSINSFAKKFFNVNNFLDTNRPPIKFFSVNKILAQKIDVAVIYDFLDQSIKLKNSVLENQPQQTLDRMQDAVDYGLAAAVSVFSYREELPSFFQQKVHNLVYQKSTQISDFFKKMVIKFAQTPELDVADETAEPSRFLPPFFEKAKYEPDMLLNLLDNFLFKKQPNSIDIALSTQILKNPNFDTDSLDRLFKDFFSFNYENLKNNITLQEFSSKILQSSKLSNDIFEHIKNQFKDLRSPDKEHVCNFLLPILKNKKVNNEFLIEIWSNKDFFALDFNKINQNVSTQHLDLFVDFWSKTSAFNDININVFIGRDDIKHDMLLRLYQLKPENKMVQKIMSHPQNNNFLVASGFYPDSSELYQKNVLFFYRDQQFLQKPSVAAFKGCLKSFKELNVVGAAQTNILTDRVNFLGGFLKSLPKDKISQDVLHEVYVDIVDILQTLHDNYFKDPNSFDLLFDQFIEIVDKAKIFFWNDPKIFNIIKEKLLDGNKKYIDVLFQIFTKYPTEIKDIYRELLNDVEFLSEIGLQNVFNAIEILDAPDVKLNYLNFSIVKNPNFKVIENRFYDFLWKKFIQQKDMLSVAEVVDDMTLLADQLIELSDKSVHFFMKFVENDYYFALEKFYETNPFIFESDSTYTLQFHRSLKDFIKKNVLRDNISFYFTFLCTITSDLDKEALEQIILKNQAEAGKTLRLLQKKNLLSALIDFFIERPDLFLKLKPSQFEKIFKSITNQFSLFFYKKTLTQSEILNYNRLAELVSGFLADKSADFLANNLKKSMQKYLTVPGFAQNAHFINKAIKNILSLKDSEKITKYFLLEVLLGNKKFIDDSTLVSPIFFQAVNQIPVEFFKKNVVKSQEDFLGFVSCFLTAEKFTDFLKQNDVGDLYVKSINDQFLNLLDQAKGFVTQNNNRQLTYFLTQSDTLNFQNLYQYYFNVLKVNPETQDILSVLINNISRLPNNKHFLVKVFADVFSSSLQNLVDCLAAYHESVSIKNLIDVIDQIAEIHYTHFEFVFSNFDAEQVSFWSKQIFDVIQNLPIDHSDLYILIFYFLKFFKLMFNKNSNLFKVVFLNLINFLEKNNFSDLTKLVENFTYFKFLSADDLNFLSSAYSLFVRLSLPKVKRSPNVDYLTSIFLLRLKQIQHVSGLNLSQQTKDFLKNLKLFKKIILSQNVTAWLEKTDTINETLSFIANTQFLIETLQNNSLKKRYAKMYNDIIREIAPHITFIVLSTSDVNDLNVQFLKRILFKNEEVLMQLKADILTKSAQQLSKAETVLYLFMANHFSLNIPEDVLGQIKNVFLSDSTVYNFTFLLNLFKLCRLDPKLDLPTLAILSPNLFDVFIVALKSFKKMDFAHAELLCQQIHTLTDTLILNVNKHKIQLLNVIKIMEILFNYLTNFSGQEQKSINQYIYNTIIKMLSSVDFLKLRPDSFVAVLDFLKNWGDLSKKGVNLTETFLPSDTRIFDYLYDHFYFNQSTLSGNVANVQSYIDILKNIKLPNFDYTQFMIYLGKTNPTFATLLISYGLIPKDNIVILLREPNLLKNIFEILSNYTYFSGRDQNLFMQHFVEAIKQSIGPPEGLNNLKQLLLTNLNFKNLNFINLVDLSFDLFTENEKSLIKNKIQQHQDDINNFWTEPTKNDEQENEKFHKQVHFLNVLNKTNALPFDRFFTLFSYFLLKSKKTQKRHLREHLAFLDLKNYIFGAGDEAIKIIKKTSSLEHRGADFIIFSLILNNFLNSSERSKLIEAVKDQQNYFAPINIFDYATAQFTDQDFKTFLDIEKRTVYKDFWSSHDFLVKKATPDAKYETTNRFSLYSLNLTSMPRVLQTINEMRRDQILEKTSVDIYEWPQTISVPTVSPHLYTLQNVLDEFGEITWKDFKDRYEKLANVPVIKNMFMGDPKHTLSQDKLNLFLNNLPHEKYFLSYDFWSGAQRYSSYNNLCVQINLTEELINYLRSPEQKPLANLFLFLLYSQNFQNFTKILPFDSLTPFELQKHPLSPFSIGWIRLHCIDRENWLIEEFQSDFAQRLNANAERALKNKRPVIIGDMVYDHVQYFQYVNIIKNLLSGWHEKFLNIITQIAKQKNVRNLFLLSASIKQNILGDTEKKLYVKTLYDDLPFKYNFEATSAEAFKEKYKIVVPSASVDDIIWLKKLKK